MSRVYFREFSKKSPNWPLVILLFTLGGSRLKCYYGDPKQSDLHLEH